MWLHMPGTKRSAGVALQDESREFAGDEALKPEQLF